MARGQCLGRRDQTDPGLLLTDSFRSDNSVDEKENGATCKPTNDLLFFEVRNHTRPWPVRLAAHLTRTPFSLHQLDQDHVDQIKETPQGNKYLINLIESPGQATAVRQDISANFRVTDGWDQSQSPSVNSELTSSTAESLLLSALLMVSTHRQWPLLDRL